METVSITFIDDTVKHFIDAVCSIDMFEVVVSQHKENNKIHRHHFKKKNIKSITYNC